MYKIIILFIFILLNLNAFSYVRTKTDSGKDIYWSISGNEIPFFIYSNPSSTGATYGIDSFTSENIILNAVNAWNEESPLKLNPQIVSSLSSISDPKVGTISYSNNPMYFGEGVLAITKVRFNANTGTISGGDILINDSFMNLTSFTTSAALSSNGNAYLGDVVAHEIGHLLGLAHTEVPGASMLYSIFKNQHTPSSDEIIAMKDVYNGMNKRISGKIVGGKNKSVFGANVFLLSQKTGKVVMSKLSEEDGSFSFSNIPLDDSYFLAILPVKNKENLPNYYKKLNTDFCGGSFVPSFYTKCGARSKGRAEAINLSQHGLNHYDIGEITIRCNFTLSSQYLFEKIQEDRVSIPYFNYNMNLGETYLGLIFPEDISNSIPDIFHMDATTYVAGPDEYLKINLYAESIATDIDFVIRVKNLSLGTTKTYHSTSDPLSGKKNLDRTLYIPLSLNQSENDFEVSLEPLSLSSFQRNEIFSGAVEMVNKEKIYLLATSVVKKIGSTYSALDLADTYPYEDNKACLEGNIPYEARATRTIENDTSQNDENQNVVSCGTIGPVGGNGGGSGPASFFVGFFLVIICSILGQRGSNFLSK